MQRSAVKRIGDIISTLLWAGLFGYDLWWGVSLGYLGFFTATPVPLADIILNPILLIWSGWFFGVQIHTLRKYRTLPWVRENLVLIVKAAISRNFLKFIQWQLRGLNRLFSRWYPGMFEEPLEVGISDAYTTHESYNLYDSDLVNASPSFTRPTVIYAQPDQLYPTHEDGWHDELLS